MHDVNWWLMALAFLLGLLLTLALTIRKVTREVPVTHAVSAGIAKPQLDKPVKAAGAAVATGAALAGAAKKVEKKVQNVEKKVERRLEPDILEEDPYGSGSIRVSARKVGPAGYTIKGDKDTGRYFTLDSPEYEAIEAEVWFANEESAEKAGFLRWNATGARKVGLIAGAEALVTEKRVDADSSLVIVDDGVAEAKTVIVDDGYADADADLVVNDDGYADADADLVIVEGGPARKTASLRAEDAGPYGKGSARAAADGSGPAGWVIKGNADSMLYHGTDSPYYEQTIAEFWFVDEATAKAAGFAKWDKNIR